MDSPTAVKAPKKKDEVVVAKDSTALT